MLRKPFTVILGPTDTDPKLTSHLVTELNVDKAIRAAMYEAGVEHAEDAIVLAGHHEDLRRSNKAVTSRPTRPPTREVMTNLEVRRRGLAKLAASGLPVEITTISDPRADQRPGLIYCPLPEYGVALRAYRKVTDPYVSS